MPTKYHAIYFWKKRGLIHDDYDALYEEYINTTHCQHCNVEFKNSYYRHMDHDHETGLFRKIVCNRCNIWDGYINYPNGYVRKEYMKKYIEQNYEKIKEQKQEKITCLCGCISARGHLSRHKKTENHMKLMDLYMNNID